MRNKGTIVCDISGLKFNLNAIFPQLILIFFYLPKKKYAMRKMEGSSFLNFRTEFHFEPIPFPGELNVNLFTKSVYKYYNMRCENWGDNILRNFKTKFQFGCTCQI